MKLRYPRGGGIWYNCGVMTRTQIQLPDELYRRAKALAADREISLAELVRNGLEHMLAALTPPGSAQPPAAELPILDLPIQPDFDYPDLETDGGWAEAAETPSRKGKSR